MIVLLIALWSLCAIYFTRLFTQRKMRAATISVTVLYLYLIAWIYAVFILDIADLGFAETETRLTLLHGSNVYHAFVQMTAKMSFIPLPLLKAIVGVAILIISAGVSVALHGVFTISRDIYRFVKEYRFESEKNTAWEIGDYDIPAKAVSIIRMYCRANC